jgi:hypothetical protein
MNHPDRVQQDLEYNRSLNPIVDNRDDDVAAVTAILSESGFLQFPLVVLKLLMSRLIEFLRLKSVEEFKASFLKTISKKTVHFSPISVAYPMYNHYPGIS